MHRFSNFSSAKGNCLSLSNLLVYLSGMLFILTSGACAFIRSDSEPVPRADLDKITIADSLRPALSGWPESKWWESYNNEQLNNLVEQALAGSPSLAIAQKRAELAKAQAELVRAGSFPFVDMVGNIQRQHVSDAGFLGPYAQDMPLLGLDGPWYTSGTLGLFGSYELDIWGKNSSQVEAALGAYRAGLAEEAQVRLVIACAVTQIYWDMQTLFGLKNILMEARDIEKTSLAAEQARHTRGLIANTDVELAKARVNNLEEQIAAAEGGIHLLQASLKAMLGLETPLPPIAPVPLPEVHGRLPQTLGYELLARRPDLQAAHWYIEASLDEVDAARAAFYPSFNLLAFFGTDAIHLGDLFSHGSQQFNLIGGLSLPIFDSGRLNANLKVVRAQSDLSILSYNQAVVNAVREVTESAARLMALEKQTARQEEAVSSLDYAWQSAQAYQKRGLLDRAAADQAKLPLLVAEGRAIELRGQWIGAEISLIKALGGGYRAASPEDMSQDPDSQKPEPDSNEPDSAD